MPIWGIRRHLPSSKFPEMPVPSTLTLATSGPPFAASVVLAVVAWTAFRTWQWRTLQRWWRDHPDAELVTVMDVYQVARTGTKAVVVRQHGGRQDAWFPGRRVRTGSHALVVAGNSGWGPHNRDPHVFYANIVVATCGATGPLFASALARIDARARRSTPRRRPGRR